MRRFWWIVFFLFILVGCGQAKPAQTLPAPAKAQAQAAADPEATKQTEPNTNLSGPTWYTGKVIVLTYHHIDEKDKSPYTITPALFRQHMEYLKKSNFHPLKLNEFYEYMNTGLLTKDNAVLITFDDGYESFYTQAYPVLKELDFPATEFVTYAKLKDSLDRKRDHMIPPLTFVEIEEMVKIGLFSFQAHTYSLHDQTEKESNEGDQAYRSRLYVDFMEAKAAIEDVTKKPVQGFAYPNGYDSPDFLRVVKESGYKFGFTGNYGVVNRQTNPLLIPRLETGKPEISVDDLNKLLMGLKDE